MKKLILFIAFMAFALLGYGQYTISDQGPTISISGNNENLLLSKEGLIFQKITPTLYFISNDRQYTFRYTEIDVPAYSTIDSIYNEVLGWINSPTYNKLTADTVQAIYIGNPYVPEVITCDTTFTDPPCEEHTYHSLTVIDATEEMGAYILVSLDTTHGCYVYDTSFIGATTWYYPYVTMNQGYANEHIESSIPGDLPLYTPALVDTSLDQELGMDFLVMFGQTHVMLLFSTVENDSVYTVPAVTYTTDCDTTAGYYPEVVIPSIGGVVDSLECSEEIGWVEFSGYAYDEDDWYYIGLSQYFSFDSLCYMNFDNIMHDSSYFIPEMYVYGHEDTNYDTIHIINSLTYDQWVQSISISVDEVYAYIEVVNGYSQLSIIWGTNHSDLFPISEGWILDSIFFPKYTYSNQNITMHGDVNVEEIVFPDNTYLLSNPWQYMYKPEFNTYAITSDAENNNGWGSIIIGDNVLSNHPYASSCVIIGTTAAYDVSSQISNNVFIGSSAAYSNNGTYQTIIGDAAGTSCGGNSTAIGAKALQTGGLSNTAIGFSAGEQAGSGQYNFYGGNEAGQVNTGSYNVCIGYRAGMYASTGQNTFVGSMAGSKKSAGTYNTYVGYNTGVGNSNVSLNTGQNNTVLGAGAAVFLTKGSDNLILGAYAGASDSTGNQNVFIGSEAGAANYNGSNNIFLGYSAGYSESGSNKLYIENSNSATPLIYGEFDNKILRVYGTKVERNDKTIANNDATPDVSASNVWTYAGSANAVTITDLDNPDVGAIYYIIGNSDTYTITIADSENFNLSAQWVGGVDDVLILYVQADNDYIELGRVNN